MGQQGEDIIMSPAAKRLLPLRIECKAVEALNVPTVFNKHYAHYEASKDLKLLVHRRNRAAALVTLRWSDFKNMLGALIGHL